MKKVVFILSIVMSVSSFLDHAYAGCTMKCIARNPITGKCIAKTKVCDIGTPKEIIEQAEKEVKKLTQSVQSTWHDLYKTALPENIRTIINNYSFTIIGKSLGGLESAAFGIAIDKAIVELKQMFIVAKEIKIGMVDWQQDFIDEGTAHVTITRTKIVTSGQASKQYFSDEIRPVFDEFLSCVKSSIEYSDGLQCVDDLRTSLLEIEMNARRK